MRCSAQQLGTDSLVGNRRYLRNELAEPDAQNTSIYGAREQRRRRQAMVCKIQDEISPNLAFSIVVVARFELIVFEHVCAEYPLVLLLSTGALTSACLLTHFAASRRDGTGGGSRYVVLPELKHLFVQQKATAAFNCGFFVLCADFVRNPSAIQDGSLSWVRSPPSGSLD